MKSMPSSAPRPDAASPRNVPPFRQVHIAIECEKGWCLFDWGDFDRSPMARQWVRMMDVSPGDFLAGACLAPAAAGFARGKSYADLGCCHRADPETARRGRSTAWNHKFGIAGPILRDGHFVASLRMRSNSVETQQTSC